MSRPRDIIQAANYAQIYQTIIKHLSKSERIKMAPGASGELLKAFCFEPDDQVIRIVIDNQSFGLNHARLVAAHHHTSAGLEYLTRKPVFANDNAVRAGLHRNRGSSQIVLNRTFQSLDLFRLHNLAQGREASQHVIMKARDALRLKFEQSTPE